MIKHAIYMQPSAVRVPKQNQTKIRASAILSSSMMVLAPSLPTVEPVINSGRVGLWLVKHLGAHTPAGKVTPRVEHAPPHVVGLAHRRWRWSRRCCRCPRARRHRQRPLVATTHISLIVGADRNIISIHLSELAKSTLRVRAGQYIVP